MGRISTLPIEFEDLRTIRIARLKEWGYLEENNHQRFGIHWADRNNQITASISCIINMYELYLELSYNYNGTPVKYRIKLDSKQSNLGKGNYYYFICHKSNKRARKLYLHKGLFLHRSCIKGYYFSQLVSVKDRPLIQEYRKQFAKEKAFEQSLNKYYKRTYKGKFTKRYFKFKESYLDKGV